MKEKQKKIFAAVTLVIALAVMGFITVAITLQLRKIGSAPEDMREFFASFGWGAPAVALGLQVLQILIAFIPGELVESGMGFAFGAPIGTLLCYLGLAIGEALVFILIRRFGTRALEYFVPREKFERFEFLRDENKFKKVLFILFVIPGTPKDMLTYIAPLYKIKLSEFLIITLIARFPSVISSTVGGHLLSSKNYLGAAVMYAVTGALSLLGMYLYNLIMKKKSAHAHKN